MKLTAHLQQVSSWLMSEAMRPVHHMPLWGMLGQLCTVCLPLIDTVLQNGRWDVDAYIAFLCLYKCLCHSRHSEFLVELYSLLRSLSKPTVALLVKYNLKFNKWVLWTWAVSKFMVILFFC